MKKPIYLSAVLLLLLLCNSCIGDGDFHDSYSPVVMNRSDFENSIDTQSSQSVNRPGKIYIKDDLMFVNETNKGFHVYDYSDPSNPVRFGFLKIAGATDLAIRNDIIYINQATDLVTLQYDPSNNSVDQLDRIKNVFPPKTSPNGTTANVGNNKVVVDWTEH